MAVNGAPIRPYDQSSFRRSYTTGSHEKAPAVFSAPCLLGIDEAGRGPVSGACHATELARTCELTSNPVDRPHAWTPRQVPWCTVCAIAR